MMNLQCSECLTPEASLLWALCLGAIGLGVWLVAVLRCWQLGAQLRRARSMPPAPARFASGPALLQGRVETQNGEPAVRVEIEQLGTEQRVKGEWSHRWREYMRTVRVQDFQLQLARGERILVAPDQSVRLIAPLETLPRSADQRTRVAVLAAGESAWVSGTLEHIHNHDGTPLAARGDAPSWRLRGSAECPLQITTPSLEASLTEQHASYRRAAWWLALGVLLHLTIFSAFYALLLAGKTEAVLISRTYTYLTQRKNGSKVEHYMIVGAIHPPKGGMLVEGEVDKHPYDMLRFGFVQRLPFTYVPGLPFIHDVGAHATVTTVAVMLGSLLAGSSAIALVVFVLNARPWHVRQPLVEGGAGRLSQSS